MQICILTSTSAFNTVTLSQVNRFTHLIDVVISSSVSHPSHPEIPEMIKKNWTRASPQGQICRCYYRNIRGERGIPLSPNMTCCLLCARSHSLSFFPVLLSRLLSSARLSPYTVLSLHTPVAHSLGHIFLPSLALAHN